MRDRALDRGREAFGALTVLPARAIRQLDTAQSCELTKRTQLRVFFDDGGDFALLVLTDHDVDEALAEATGRRDVVELTIGAGLDLGPPRIVEGRRNLDAHVDRFLMREVT